MTKPFTLQPLLTLAKHQSDSASYKLGQLNQQQQSAQNKLEVLQQYRKDYVELMQEATQNGINPTALRNFQEFINKLDEAINHQLKVVNQSQISTQIGRKEFDTTLRKLKSFDVLQQRHLEIQKKVTEKSEQIKLDEHTRVSSSYKKLNIEDPN